MSRTPLLQDAMAFFAGLEADNSKECFERERPRYDEARATFVELCDSLTGWGPWRVYRAQNDRRFRAEADPYKTFLGAVAERPDGVGAFVRVDASGLLVGTGIPMPAPDQLGRLRDAVADDRSGSALESAIDAVRARGLAVHGGRWEPLRRVPRGYPADSPRAELLRWKGVEANVRVCSPRWTTVAAAARAVDGSLAGAGELQAWLGAHVGPSALSAEERFAPRSRRR